MKRPKLRIIGIEEGEETQVKSTENIFKKVVKKILQPKEGDDYQDTRSIQSTKQTGPKMEFPTTQNLHRMNMKNCKGKD